MTIESLSAQDTFDFGVKLGRNAKPGTIICLDGDLGTGKTVISKGIAKGLGIDEPVSSPTFTVVQIYTEGRLPLYHFDVYRIEDPVEMEEIGYEEYFFGDGVTVVEWSDMIAELIPAEAVKIVLKKQIERGFEFRSIEAENLEL
ncbi:MAG: tRNA (adenosine(37)-N6)-threonylcarbamoyltransferase complex ATPase subunit type 1 TsaE [Lachnospiraceae bacterium]|nr:tRNA (adenosine(37)-N6)-threonylcarbamoyltransferase complex ATPase subunit type 1 TsaE [Lachnospiraceae bacterium]